MRASNGSTSTPPGAASIRTSRPSTTRCSPPSCQRLARSTPNTRKRSVESAKSYGSGKRSSNVVERLERLVVGRRLRAGSPRATRGRRRGRRRARRSGRRCRHRRRRAAARPAGSAACTCRGTPGRGPSSRKRSRQPSGSGSASLLRTSIVDSLPFEHRADQLRQAARDDHGSGPGGEAVEPGPETDVLDGPGGDLGRARPQRPDLRRERLAVGAEAAVEDRRVAERPDRLDQRVVDGARPVPVEDELHRAGHWYNGTHGR